jgi:hypothetical protein
MQEINQILEEQQFLTELYGKLLKILPSFNIADKKVLPYGLKSHTRSVSWLVEQVVCQQTKFRAKQLGLKEVKFDMPDTCLHDCEIKTKNKTYYVNIKIHNSQNSKKNKNDISAVEKLFFQYSSNPNYDLFYVAFGIFFDDITIKFDTKNILVFSPQFLPIYVNPRNDKIQSYYEHNPVLRTRKEFLETLKQNSKSIILK